VSGELLRGSLLEPTIRNHARNCATEFGKMIKLQEAENQIVTEYEVLVRAIETHQATSGRVPHLAAFYSGKKPRKPKASSACVFQIAQPRAPNANASRRNVGSATARNGAPAARAASALPSGRQSQPPISERGSGSGDCRQPHQYWSGNPKRG
jgi:hypothetical protein